MATIDARELTQHIVDTLNLEYTVDEIDVDAQLFGDDGLGLDSIDGLEIAMAVRKKYDVVIEEGDSQTALVSIQSLKTFIEQKLQQKAQSASND